MSLAPPKNPCPERPPSGAAGGHMALAAYNFWGRTPRTGGPHSFRVGEGVWVHEPATADIPARWTPGLVLEFNGLSRCYLAVDEHDQMRARLLPLARLALRRAGENGPSPEALAQTRNLQNGGAA